MKAPRSCPNSSLSIRSLGNRSHVEGDEGPCSARAEIVQGPGHEFLSRSRFPKNQDRQVRVHDAGDDPVYPLHRGRPADHRQVVRGGLRASGRHYPCLCDGAANGRDQFVEIEGFREVLECATFAGAERGEHGRAGADNNHGKARTDLLDAWQEVQPVARRHGHIRDDKIAVTGTDPRPEFAHVPGVAGYEPVPVKGSPNYRADGGIVIANQHRGFRGRGRIHCTASVTGVADSACDGVTAGRYTVNLVPVPSGASVTSTTPP